MCSTRVACVFCFSFLKFSLVENERWQRHRCDIFFVNFRAAFSNFKKWNEIRFTISLCLHHLLGSGLPRFVIITFGLSVFIRVIAGPALRPNSWMTQEAADEDEDDDDGDEKEVAKWPDGYYHLKMDPV